MNLAQAISHPTHRFPSPSQANMHPWRSLCSVGAAAGSVLGSGRTRVPSGVGGHAWSALAACHPVPGTWHLSTVNMLFLDPPSGRAVSLIFRLHSPLKSYQIFSDLLLVGVTHSLYNIFLILNRLFNIILLLQSMLQILRTRFCVSPS